MSIRTITNQIFNSNSRQTNSKTPLNYRHRTVFEQLESREMLTQLVEFDQGILDIVLTASGNEGETIVLANDRGNVVDLSGGTQLGAAAISADSVQEIRIHGSSKGDLINLSQVNEQVFRNLDSVTVYGKGGADEIIGSELADRIFAGRHDDFIDGLGGNDVIFGGLGNDELLGGDGQDKLFGGQGSDFLFGNSGSNDADGWSDSLKGGRGKDFAFSEAVDLVKSASKQRRPDSPIGDLDGREPQFPTSVQSQEQVVTFENGVLKIQLNHTGRRGGTVSLGNDRGRVVDFSLNSPLNDVMNVRAEEVLEIQILGSKRGDAINLSQVDSASFPNLQQTKIWGRAGRDAIVGSEVRDEIFGGKHNDTVEGLGGDDLIRGNSGNDSLQGGDGVDTIFGGVGEDWLYGFTHASRSDGHRDFLHGGRDNDKDWGIGEKRDRIRFCT